MSDSEKKSPQMFVIDTAPTIKWPVTVSVPVDGGQVGTYQFTGIFKRLSDEELDKLLSVEEPAKLEPAKDGEGMTIGTVIERRPRMQDTLRENAELFPQLLVGWENVKTSSGVDAPFGIEALQKQITGPNGKFLSIGLWQAVAEIRSGARLGN